MRWGIWVSLTWTCRLRRVAYGRAVTMRAVRKLPNSTLGRDARPGDAADYGQDRGKHLPGFRRRHADTGPLVHRRRGHVPQSHAGDGRWTSQGDLQACQIDTAA